MDSGGDGAVVDEPAAALPSDAAGPLDSPAEPLEEPGAGEEPTRAELEARLAAERQALADAVPPPVAEELAEAIASVATHLAELERQDGPPDAEATEELVQVLVALREQDTGEHEAAILALAETFMALTERAPTPTPEERQELEELEELEKARKSYATKVAKIRGPGRELEPCAACAGTGFGAGAESDEAVTYREHEHYRSCHECDGYGTVLTGSKRPELLTQGCPGCGGRGFLTLQSRPAGENGNGEPGTGEPVYGLEPWMGDPNVAPAAGGLA